MNILIDIGHPAHVHLFKNFALEMQDKGHHILFTCREKEFEIGLLKKYGFKYISFGKKYNSVPGKIWGLVEFDIKAFISGLKFKPDILLSHGSMYAAHASFLLGRPHISFEDTFNFEQIFLYKAFTKIILTSDYEHSLKSDKVISYSGYHELAYLHPKRFVPDKSIFSELRLAENEKYVIIRYVSRNASHDLGHKGFSFENKLNAVKAFEKYAKVLISSESILPDELEKYRIAIEPHRMHDAIAFSSLIFGESSTMAEEAAMLGIPSIFLLNNSTLYTAHLENDYQLMFNYSESEKDQKQAINKGVEILSMPGLKAEWGKKRDKMLSDRIDVTAFMVWFIEKYPESAAIMRDNPDYQLRFK